MYKYTAPFYISGFRTLVQVVNSNFHDLQYGSKGGLFYLSETIFNSKNSTYTNNSAILGGVIYCYACEISL